MRIETLEHSENQIGHGDHDDAVSVVSTVRYDHESFESFQHKVSQLIAQHFTREVFDIKIEHIKGGSFNRVVGVTLSVKTKNSILTWFLSACSGTRYRANLPVESYIVRIPRQDGSEMDRDVAILKALEAQLTLPIPKVVAYDLSTENVFEKPYMVQTRLVGRNLAQLWETLNMEQKKCVAKRVTKLVSSIASVEAPAGNLALEHLSRDSDGCIRVEKFCVPARGLEDESFNKPNTWPAQPQKPLDHLLEQCERWREYQISQGACFEEIWDGFAAISNALQARGFLDGPCVLLHGDLKAYNLLAEVCSQTEVQITGVLDWDYAIVAPEIIAYRAPFWLWLPGDMNSVDEDDESNANLEPRTDEDWALKDAFLSQASGKYRRFAFAPEAMLARRMFPILQKGVFGPWNVMEAENIIREWDELHPEDGVAVLDADDLG